jgi:transcriptional regulator with XRE-family HTH domain
VTGIRLAELRKALNLSQRKLSELSGVSRVTIARLELGAQSPSLETLTRLADALKVPLDELVDRKGA